MKVGVVGAGTMGTGIAQTFLYPEDNEVILCDVNEELTNNAIKIISKALEKVVAKNRITRAKAEAMMGRLFSGSIDQLKGCDLVIESIVEDMDKKKELFNSLQQICGASTIYVSNTSSLSLTELSDGLRYPVTGMHFFNPAPVMKLVEVVSGLGAPESVSIKIAEIAEKIGKEPVLVKEGPGFIVNRILIPMINEGIGIYADGLATVGNIDTAMKLGANHPMGPLELGDLIGLDVCLAIMENLYSEFGDPKYRPHPLLKQMVRAGKFGRKTGQGFYTY